MYQTYFLILPLLVCWYTSSAAQVFTAFGASFTRLEILERVGFEYTATVKLDVLNGRPTIKEISAPYRIAELEVTSYLNNLIFISDTTDYTITFIVALSSHLMNPYCEVWGDTITLMYPKCPRIIRCPIYQLTTNMDDKGNCQFVLAVTAPTSAYLQKTADIYLERIFSADSDSTIVVRNNYPEALGDILSFAKQYGKKEFEELLSEGAGDCTRRKYFLQVSLYHDYPCNIHIRK